MNKRILHNIKTHTVRILSLCVMLCIVVGSVYYIKGYFDFTFIERVPLSPDAETAEETEAVTESVSETEPVGEATAALPGVDTAEIGETAVPDSAHPSAPPVQETPKKETAKTVSASLKKAKAAQSSGYRFQTEGIFKKGKSILANIGISGLGSQYSYSTYDARVTDIVEYERGCMVTEESYVKTARPAVMLRNGYIIRDINGKLSLLRADGSTVLSDYDESVFRLTELRDRNGNALFASVKKEKREIPVPIMIKKEFTGQLIESGLYEEDVTQTVEVEVLTYYTLSADGKWVESDYTDEYPHAESDMGLTFDAPLDFGKSDSDIERYYNGYSWGYRNAKTGDIVVYPRYVRAYNFHDGYAVAYDHYAMYFLNEKGSVLYSVKYDKPEVFATYNEVTLPDTNGIEALGAYYFSHGLTRVRIRENLISYKVYYYIKESDKTVLLDEKGNEFPVPVGYTLISYSDGVLLLQNNETGLLGCMNYKGAWIVQPAYSHVTPSLSGMIVVGQKNGKKGLYDTEGNQILPQVYDEISAPSAGMVAVYDKTSGLGWEVYRMMSK